MLSLVLEDVTLFLFYVYSVKLNDDKTLKGEFYCWNELLTFKLYFGESSTLTIG
jgi:hypothetical protein